MLVQKVAAIPRISYKNRPRTLIFLLPVAVYLSPLYEFAWMRDQLTESQVARVVAEVTRQAQLRELDERGVCERGQVVQILEELKLPVELLDPAMQELERREAEAEAKARYEEALGANRRRTFRIIGAALALV